MPDSSAEPVHPERAREAAISVLRRLRDAGFEAYFAGGCVRDLLMGQTPKDYDVATNAQPNQVRGLFKNTQAVGAAFGVILVRDGKSVIEVATFRTDLEYRDGRHPAGVQFSTAEEDAKRRDFTINGLFLDPIENRIIDHVGGQADLQARKLRAIGDADQRFAEDHLRMLRAVRFASRLGFEIEIQTTAAIKAHAAELIRISPERIAEELRKMLTPATRDRAFLLLRRFGFIQILMRFFPEKGKADQEWLHDPDAGSEVRRRAGSNAGEPGSSEYLRTGVVGEHATNPTAPEPMKLFLSLNGDGPISFGLALAAIVLDFRMQAAENFDVHRWLAPAEIKRAAQVMRQTLKISNEESDEMTGSMSFIQLLGDTPPTVARLKRFLNQPHSADAERLMTAIGKIGLLSDRINAVLKSLDHWRTTDFAPPPLITGDDLTAAGASPGPKFKVALDAAYDAQLEGTIASREEAMGMAMAIVRNPKSE